MNTYKSTFVLILCLITIYWAKAQAPAHNIQISALAPVVGKFELSYEHALSQRISLELDGGSIHQRKSGQRTRVGTTDVRSEFNVSCLLCSEEATFVRVNGGKKGYFVELGPKFYIDLRPNLEKRGMIYIKPELTFMQYRFDQYRIEHRFVENRRQETTTFEALRMTNFGGKLNMGTRWLIGQRISIDVFGFVGGQTSSPRAEEDVLYSGERAMYLPKKQATNQWGIDFLRFTYSPITMGGGIKLGYVW